MSSTLKTPSDWAKSTAANHLFGDNLPSGAESHIEALALLLDRVRAEEREACAAYCLDRADQYETRSGVWVGISECAEGIAKGDAAAALREGETEDLLERVRRMAGFTRKTPKPKDRGDGQ